MASISDPVFCKKIRVNIQKSPNEKIKIDNIVIEKYELNKNELEVPSDPNLVCDLHFR